MVADDEGVVVSPAFCNYVGFVILLAMDMDGDDLDLAAVVMVVMVFFTLVFGVPGIGIDGDGNDGRLGVEGFLDVTALQ